MNHFFFGQTSRRRLLLTFASTLPLPTHSQLTEAVCTSGWSWALNLQGSSPCLVIAQLRAACLNSTYTLPSINAGYHYSSNGVCTCNLPVYNLESACAACQDRDWLTWTQWISTCTPITTDSYPFPLPKNVSIPSWAYIRTDLQAEQTWDEAVAQANGTLNPNNPADSAAQANSGGVGKGLIAGAIAGGLGALFLAIFVFLAYTHYRRKMVRYNDPFIPPERVSGARSPAPRSLSSEKELGHQRTYSSMSKSLYSVPPSTPAASSPLLNEQEMLQSQTRSPSSGRRTLFSLASPSPEFAPYAGPPSSSHFASNGSTRHMELSSVEEMNRSRSKYVVQTLDPPDTMSPRRGGYADAINHASRSQGSAWTQPPPPPRTGTPGQFPGVAEIY